MPGARIATAVTLGLAFVLATAGLLYRFTYASLLKADVEWLSYLERTIGAIAIFKAHAALTQCLPFKLQVRGARTPVKALRTRVIGSIPKGDDPVPLLLGCRQGSDRPSRHWNANKLVSFDLEADQAPSQQPENA